MIALHKYKRPVGVRLAHAKSEPHPRET